ncbi:MAG: hypothetical protein HYR85_04830 [Planctomycetes bacterium]|nr:hypothetical protein [Planctomycetota bacterium]MBI3843481.1 hypothetical protein [Planctomycetota bacterium]
MILTRIIATALFVSSLGLSRFVPAPAACDVCHDQKTVQCPNCEGKGTFLDKCPTCEGKGKMPCPIEGCGTTKKGMLPCPNKSCVKGMIPWEGGDKDSCHICSGRGAIDCPTCNDSEVTCFRCAGKHTVQWGCLDCRSTGRLPCPKCQLRVDASDCVWCHGAHDLTCPRCKGSGNELFVCPVCRGTDKAYCTECLGLGKVACDTCHGTGWKRYKMVDRSGVNHGSGGRRQCDSCNGTGTETCPQGKDRQLPCWIGNVLKRWKHVEGKLVASCLWCDGDKHLPCGGCYRGEQRGLEISARVLAKANHHAEAATMLRAALARAQAYFARGPQGEVKSPDDLAKFNRARSDTLARIEGEIATEEKTPAK